MRRYDRDWSVWYLPVLYIDTSQSHTHTHTRTSEHICRNIVCRNSQVPEATTRCLKNGWLPLTYACIEKEKLSCCRETARRSLTILLRPPRRWLCGHCGLSVCVHVWNYVCVQDCKSNQPISWKLGVIGPTSRKILLTFSVDRVPRTFPLLSLLRDFMRSVSISHTVTGRCSRHSAKWRTPTS